MHGYKEVMRMKRTSRILSLILALAMVVCALVCVTASATEPENLPVIVGANVVYGDEIRMAFTIDAVGNNGEYGIALVEGDEENGYVVKYQNFTAETSEGVTYYVTQGIAPKDIDTAYQYAVVEKVGDEVKIVSTPVTYSVRKYAEERLRDTSITEARRNLYSKLLAYGEAASAVLKK